LEHHPQKHTHILHKYNIPCIPTLQGYKIPSPKNELENYACAICILFTPWRTYRDIKQSINALSIQNLNVIYPHIPCFDTYYLKH
jgi:hypothetical protein